MGVGSEGQGGPWIFIYSSDKVEGGLLMLFFGLIFSVASTPIPGIFSVDTLARIIFNFCHKNNFTIFYLCFNDKGFDSIDWRRH